MAELDDLLLIRQCLQGHSGSFGALIDRYQKPIFNVALRMVHDDDDAADIAQAVFVKAFENLRSFNPKHRFFSWIYRMAVNESINLIKRTERFEGMQEEPAAIAKTPADDYEEGETSAAIRRALATLNLDYRAVIILKHFEGFSYLEIAEILGIPEKKVKSRLFTARTMLKDILLKQGFAQYD